MPFVFYGCDTNRAERQCPRPLPIQSGCTRLIARRQNRCKSAAPGRMACNGTLQSSQPSRQGRKIPPCAIRPPWAPHALKVGSQKSEAKSRRPKTGSRKQKPEAGSRKPEAKTGSRKQKPEAKGRRPLTVLPEALHSASAIREPARQGYGLLPNGILLSQAQISRTQTEPPAFRPRHTGNLCAAASFPGRNYGRGRVAGTQYKGIESIGHLYNKRGRRLPSPHITRLPCCQNLCTARTRNLLYLGISMTYGGSMPICVVKASLASFSVEEK